MNSSVKQAQKCQKISAIKRIYIFHKKGLHQQERILYKYQKNENTRIRKHLQKMPQKYTIKKRIINISDKVRDEK